MASLSTGVENQTLYSSGCETLGCGVNIFNFSNFDIFYDFIIFSVDEYF